MSRFIQTLKSRRTVLTVLLVFTCAMWAGTTNASPRFDFEWKEVNEGVGVIWEPRAGLQAVNHKGRFYVLGGRAPKMSPLAFGDSIFFNDVWKSGNSGKDWSRISSGLGAPWVARAYFQAVTKGPYMYVIGGQNSVAFPNPDPTCGGALPPGVPCPESILASDFFTMYGAAETVFTGS